MSQALALVRLRDEEKRVCFSDASCEGLSFLVGAMRKGKFYVALSCCPILVRSLPPYERDYDAHEKELCAVYYSTFAAFHLL